MNLWELASRPIIPVFTPTYLRDKFCLGGKEKKKEKKKERRRKEFAILPSG